MSTHRVLVTGGAGYVGSVLVPKLLAAGHEVVVLDTYWYGRDVLAAVADHPALTEIVGDLRDLETTQQALEGCDSVIHLACISNDPSADLNEALSLAINRDASADLIDLAVEAGIERFIHVSSSSVYGIKEEPNVHEDLPLEPLTVYSRCKVDVEQMVLAANARAPDFCGVNLRPATVCGMSPRLRLDLTVNILTMLAWRNGRITVNGGDQLRPNIHIEDVTDAYVLALDWPAEVIRGQAYNIGYENHSVMEIAEMVQATFPEGSVEIVLTGSTDHRSYHISSAKIERDLGFEPSYTLKDAMSDLKTAFDEGAVEDFDDDVYVNMKRMKTLDIQA